MSSEALAVFRKHLGPELSALAEDHLNHDLLPKDLEALTTAAKTISFSTTLGSSIGLSLASLLAFRLRATRRRLFASLRASEAPSKLVYASGREEALPDFRPLMKPSLMGDVVTFGFLGAGGLFLGGETGLAVGTLQARRHVGEDREMRERIEVAWRRFRADALRKKAEMVEEGRGGGGLVI